MGAIYQPTETLLLTAIVRMSSQGGQMTFAGLPLAVGA